MAEPHGREQQPTDRERAGFARARSPRSGVQNQPSDPQGQTALRAALFGDGVEALTELVHIAGEIVQAREL